MRLTITLPFNIKITYLCKMVENSTLKTETQDTFIQEAETYMTFKVAKYIDSYYFSVLIPLGLVGNTLSFLVMIRPNNRTMSTCIYMAAISINDNLMMCSAFHYWLVSAVNIHKWYLWECKISAYLHNFCLQCATYQVLAMTVDKYIAIKWPHRAATYSTPRKAKFITCGVFMLTLSYNIPLLFVGGLLGGQCVSYVVGGTITKVFSWITFVVNGIIPFSMLIFMNSVIVQTVRESRNLFGQTTTKATKDNTLEIQQGMKTRQRAMKSAEKQLTIMLLLVTFLFSILLIPTYIRFIYLTLVKSDTPEKYARAILLFQITYKLYATNNGVNFFLYCISGQKFRYDLKELLCCTGNLSQTKKTKSESVSAITCSST